MKYTLVTAALLITLSAGTASAYGGGGGIPCMFGVVTDGYGRELITERQRIITDIQNRIHGIRAILLHMIAEKNARK